MILHPKRLLAIPMFCILCLSLVWCGDDTDTIWDDAGVNYNYNYVASSLVYDSNTTAFYDEWVGQLRMDSIYLESAGETDGR